ncbi:MAG: hypothetical protein JWQ13_1155 [Ramlibacter sp.]|jgi:hypothetical protein|nr:hypothetical protein [Ramlibacter sp.]
MSPSVRKGLGASLLALALPAAAEPYVDKVLEEGNQPSLAMTLELPRSSGWPRGWRVEYDLARDSGLQRSTSKGISFSGFLDTPGYGALSLSAAVSRTEQQDAASRQGGDDAAPLWRFDQRAFPLDGGWMANHSVGALVSLQVPMARGFGRIALPSSPLEGVTAEYLLGEQTTLNASLGRPGLYSGLGVNGFNPGRGRLAFAGGQQALPGPASSSSLAFQLFDASGIADSSNPAADQGVRGLWSAWRWEGVAPWADQVAAGGLPVWQREGGLQLQVNAMTSSATRDPAAAGLGHESGKGVWVDAQWRSQWLRQAAGVFQLEPNLRWGTYGAISDIRGIYWRGDVSTRRWQLTTSTEWTDSVSGTSGPSVFGNVSGRYRMDTRNTALAALSVRQAGANGVSAQLGWEHASDLGQTQWLADVLRAGTRRSMRLGIDHSFLLAADSALSLSAALERVHLPERDTRAFSWGVIGSTRPWSRVSVDANLRGSQGGGARQISGTLGVAWAIDPRWSVLAQFTSVRGEDPEAFALISTLTQAATSVTPVISARRFQLTLRYEDRAGSSVAPLGGAPGMGAGGIAGVVYLDADNNGRREASEAGVPNVTMVLDGRYVTRTDAQGRYEFPWVVAGEHRVQLQPDNVPLPWNPVQRDAVAAHVLVRSTTTTDFALQRDR